MCVCVLLWFDWHMSHTSVSENKNEAPSALGYSCPAALFNVWQRSNYSRSESRYTLLINTPKKREMEQKCKINWVEFVIQSVRVRGDGDQIRVRAFKSRLPRGFPPCVSRFVCCDPQRSRLEKKKQASELNFI